MENNATKVLFMPAWYPNPFQKIAGIFVKAHAQILNEHMHVAVFHICPHPDLKSLYQFEIFNDDEVQVYRMYYRNFKSIGLKPISACLFLIAGIVGYRKTLKYFGKADLNHVHILTRVGFLAWLIKIWYQVPYVISEHWSRYLPIRDSYKGFFRKLITKRVVRNSLGISAVSESLKKALIMYGLQKPVFPVISNVVDENWFLPADNSVENRGFTFLHVSGLNDEVKNIRGILNVVKAVTDQGYQFKMIIVGDDINEGLELRNYASVIGISNVLFTGKLYGADLVKQYQQADAFLLFSNFENQPCVILEALACGLPVVATKVGGVPELINPTNGILVGAKNELELQAAMITIMNGELQFDPVQIRKEAIEHHGVASVSIQFQEFYQRVMSDKLAH